MALSFDEETSLEKLKHEHRKELLALKRTINQESFENAKIILGIELEIAKVGGVRRGT